MSKLCISQEAGREAEKCKVYSCGKVRHKRGQQNSSKCLDKGLFYPYIHRERKLGITESNVFLCEFFVPAFVHTWKEWIRFSKPSSFFVQSMSSLYVTVSYLEAPQFKILI